MTTELENKLCKALRDHPYKFGNRYDDQARTALLKILFSGLTNDQPDYLSTLFPAGFPDSHKLKDAQGTTERSEYTEAARGHPCGHIFKQGEAAYHCMTCTDDATCVLCSRCFDSSDHDGHQFHISASAGNSGCCDCGDPEAWKRPVNCAIHTAPDKTGTEAKPSTLPLDLQTSIRTTIARVLDYFCDVISCSPEQLRLPKTEESLRLDESHSRLRPTSYGSGDQSVADPEYCLLVWNDEKHTVVEVRDIIKRACRQTTDFGLSKAQEAHHVGRSILRHSRDLKELIRMSNIVESIKLTTTIRTSRDTFRELMCGTIVEWLSDITGCSVGDDHHILRYTICEEMLQQWRIGSEAYNARIGREGIDDHAYNETIDRFATLPALLTVEIGPEVTVDDDEYVDEAEPRDEGEADEMDMDGFVTGEARLLAQRTGEDSTEMPLDLEAVNSLFSDRFSGEHGNSLSNPRPGSTEDRSRQPLNPGMQLQQEAGLHTSTEPVARDAPTTSQDQTRNYNNIPQTPSRRRKRLNGTQPSHWSIQPSGSGPIDRNHVPFHEDLRNNIRLDSMILFDMRMWKKTRIDLRDLYIGTVVNVPAFKRILGLRFSGLYTSLSQLYLIADREPDHSIINLSLQMLNSPSITEEVIQRGNFLTNLMAILYTFLTSRQVGFPQDVNSSATLAFDTGSVTNRRLYHFFTDLKYFLSSEPVKRKVREDRQYLLQFLDLVKLSQGICPNVRAIGDHVEYETDAWIGASLLTREINKLCRQFSESFVVANAKAKDIQRIAYVIRQSAYATIVNSVGLERARFDQTEIKEAAVFKMLRPFDFERAATPYGARTHRVIDYSVLNGALSFHHALHYTLSWLIEAGKSLSNPEMREILYQAGAGFIERNASMHSERDGIRQPEDALLALFDLPLRVCVWLAQMKAGLWVRNGMSLRHQMSQYKGVIARDVGYHRDIFLLQTAFATCDVSRVLATMIDRYGLDNWMRGMYEIKNGCEDTQLVELVEDFLYLLITILSDRASLVTIEDEPQPLLVATRKEIIHALCLKPLSFSDLNAKLSEGAQDYEDLQSVLEEMTTFRPPEGLTDFGTFELKPGYLEELDPYNSNLTKNQRDDAENIYKKRMSKKTGKPAEEIVLEPILRKIPGGSFSNLPSFTGSALFAQVIYYTLQYILVVKEVSPDVPASRVESLLHVVLQLALIATLEDRSTEDDFAEDSSQSFIRHALMSKAVLIQTQSPSTIIEVLQLISNMEEYVSCRPKIKHMLKSFCRKRAHDFNRATAHLDFPFGRLDTASPANVEQGLEAKKKQALERKARVMAQFQQQQKVFMDNQGVSDWHGDDFDEIEDGGPSFSEKKGWRYPTGVCILCQEDTNDTRLYGTFGMFTESNLQRQTDLGDADWVREVLYTPASLDQSADHLRPFGVSGGNHELVVRLTAEGKEITADRQGLGKGWPSGFTRRSAISTGCGHLMHFACFDHYFRSVVRRHAQQIARHHPERTRNYEFVCPLCKALGNAFLPILWKEKEESYPGVLAHEEPLESFLDAVVGSKLPQHTFFERSDLESAATTPTQTSASARSSFPSGIRKASSRGRFTNQSSSINASNPEMGLLVRLFTRLGDTLYANRLNRIPISSSSTETISNVEVLLSLMGNSVSAVEIAQRGVAVELGNVLLEKIPAQSLSHLRILSETIRSYISMSDGSIDALPDDFTSVQKGLFRLLFARAAASSPIDNSKRPRAATPTHLEPLLLQDIFDVFVRSCFTLGPPYKIGIHHLLQLCYLAQIVQVVVAYSYNDRGLAALSQKTESQQPQYLPSTPATGSEVHALTALTQWICDTIGGAGFVACKPAPGSEQALFTLVRAYCLTFLRKATVFLHVNHGVDFSLFSDFDSPELERLSGLLKLPSLYDMLSDFQPFSGKVATRSHVRGWIVSLANFQHAREASKGFQAPASARSIASIIEASFVDISRGIGLPHPAPLELIGLPKHFDVLMEEANRRKCPTTGMDLIDPALCLFCGEIFCSQAECCMRNKTGPANLHVTKCSSPIGIFLSIRKCTILLIHIAPKAPPPTTTRASDSSILLPNVARPEVMAAGFTPLILPVTGKWIRA